MNTEAHQESTPAEPTSALGRIWQILKSRSRSTYLWVGSILLAVGLLIGWNLFRSSQQQAEAELWYRLDTATTSIELDSLSLDEESRGTLPGLLARLHKARYALHVEGIEQFGTNNAEQRAAALNSIEKARDDYLEVADRLEELDGYPILLAEAYRGAAKAEECLVGVPKKEDPDSDRGDLDQVRKYYQQLQEVLQRLAATDPESAQTASPWAQEAASKLETLKQSQEELKAWYVKINDFLAPAKLPKNPSTPVIPKFTTPPQGNSPGEVPTRDPAAKPETPVKEPEPKSNAAPSEDTPPANPMSPEQTPAPKPSEPEKTEPKESQPKESEPKESEPKESEPKTPAKDPPMEQPKSSP